MEAMMIGAVGQSVLSGPACRRWVRSGDSRSLLARRAVAHSGLLAPMSKRLQAENEALQRQVDERRRQVDEANRQVAALTAEIGRLATMLEATNQRMLEVMSQAPRRRARRGSAGAESLAVPTPSPEEVAAFEARPLAPPPPLPTPTPKEIAAFEARPLAPPLPERPSRGKGRRLCRS